MHYLLNRTNLLQNGIQSLCWFDLLFSRNRVQNVLHSQENMNKNAEQGCLAEINTFTYEDFLYGTSLVISRAFKIEAQTVMIPFADSLNHRESSNNIHWRSHLPKGYV